MAIKIIKHGNFLRKIKCFECECEFSFNIMQDAKYTTMGSSLEKTVQCPECNKNLLAIRGDFFK